MNEEWVNKNMSIREAKIWLMFLKYEYPKDKIEELYNQVDKKYGNNLTEKQKFEYVARILERKRFKQLTYDDLNPIFFETAKSRGVTLSRTDSLDEEAIRTLRSIFNRIK